MNQELTLERAFTQEQIRSCYTVMQQLRPHLIEERLFVEQVERQLNQGYHLVYLRDHGEVKAVSGFRFLEFLAWGKVLYIDDLVTDSQARKKGYARKLLNWIVEEGRKFSCDRIHLDSGSQRHEAHKLYLNYGFRIVGYHFSLDLNIV